MQLSLDNRTPDVHEEAWVAASAALIGDVTLARGTSVFYNAVIRGDTESIRVGEDSNVQDGCVIHADPGHPVIVGARVSVGHNAVLHGCQVEDDCLIGMGATVLNGARVGAGSLIAANALILERTVVPSGTLVAGVPAKVRRELTADEVESVRRNAAQYCVLRERHRHVQERRTPSAWAN